MGIKIALDINIFISIHNDEDDSKYCEIILQAIDKNEWETWISIIVIAEMLVGYYHQGELSDADHFTYFIQNKFQIQDIDHIIAQLGAKIRSKHKIRLPDALIIASAIQNKVDILISNDIDMKNSQIQIMTPQEFVKIHC